MGSRHVEKIVQKYGRDPSFLIPILQDVQAVWNYLPAEELKEVSTQLDLPLGQVYSVATFYKAFSLTPRGKHIVHVCMGTACHVRGSQRVLEQAERDLEIEAGQTTEDLGFTLEKVNCLGSCALGPLVTVNESYHGKMNSQKISRVIKKIKKADAKRDSESEGEPKEETVQ